MAARKPRKRLARKKPEKFDYSYKPQIKVLPSETRQTVEKPPENEKKNEKKERPAKGRSSKSSRKEPYSFKPAAFQLPPEKPAKKYRPIVLFLFIIVLLAAVLLAFFFLQSKGPTEINISGPGIYEINDSVQFAKRLSIDSASPNSILIRNVGPSAVGPNEFSVYLGETKQTCRSWSTSLNPGSIRVCHFLSPCLPGQNITLQSPGSMVSIPCP